MKILLFRLLHWRRPSACLKHLGPTMPEPHTQFGFAFALRKRACIRCGRVFADVSQPLSYFDGGTSISSPFIYPEDQ